MCASFFSPKNITNNQSKFLKTWLGASTSSYNENYNLIENESFRKNSYLSKGTQVIVVQVIVVQVIVVQVIVVQVIVVQEIVYWEKNLEQLTEIYATRAYKTKVFDMK